jgi:hypothetical protein
MNDYHVWPPLSIIPASAPGHRRTHINVCNSLDNVLLYKVPFRFGHIFKFQKKIEIYLGNIYKSSV